MSIFGYGRKTRFRHVEWEGGNRCPCRKLNSSILTMQTSENTAELFALDEAEDLKMALPKLKATLCVWKPGRDWSGFSGAPAGALVGALVENAARPDSYVCGPPALNEATEGIAQEAGLPHDHVFSEQFSPAKAGTGFLQHRFGDAASGWFQPSSRSRHG
jgi:ferredoxin-NADP reductase